MIKRVAYAWVIYSAVGGLLVTWGADLIAKRCGQPQPWPGDYNYAAEVVMLPVFMPSVIASAIGGKIAGADPWARTPCSH